MKVKISVRANSYAIYVHDNDSDEFVERAMRIIAKLDVAWFQEIYDGKHRKIIVLRHVA